MIYVQGSTKKKRHLAEMAAIFAWKQLFPRINKCIVEIHLKKMDGYQGTCEQIDEREYQLQIDSKQNYEDFVTCVFHEMVHVKQYIRKELYSECVFWKTREEYINLPWEIEAYAKQEVLLSQWNKRPMPKTLVGKIFSLNRCEDHF